MTPPTSGLYDAIAPIYDEWQAWDGMTPFALIAAAKLEEALRREARRKARGEPASFARRAPSREGSGTLRGFPSQLTRHRSEPFTHLDLGCGTGTTLIELRRRQPGWRLAGIDGSHGMLAAARAKPTAQTIGFAQARLGGPLPCARQFDSCSILYDTLNHLTEPEDWTRALAAVADALRPGGVLIFDVTNRVGFELWWDGRNLFDGDGWEMSVAAHFDPAGVIGTADVVLMRAGAVGEFRLTERLYEPEEIRALVEGAGFVVERRQPWAPFARREPGKTWWVARKL